MTEIAIGVDIGSSASYIAYVGKQGTQIILNEASKRSTTSMVSFEEASRLLGDMALNKVKSNLTSTVRNFKQLLGRQIQSSDLKEEYDSNI